MNVCNANSVHVPDASCDCEEMMAELVAFEDETRDNFADVNAALDGKQDALTAGANITIVDNVISASSAGYVGSEHIEIEGNVIKAKDLVAVQDIATIVVDVMHPVGSIIIRDDDTDPSTLFPGTTWEQIKEKFLFGTGDSMWWDASVTPPVWTKKYPLGKTGGEEDHTLTVDELPAHTHSFVQGGSAIAVGTTSAETTAGFTSSTAGLWANTNKFRTAIAETGLGFSHNNMPPYLVVSIWKRTA